MARKIQTLTWVQDGLSGLERLAVDELIYIAVENVANVEAALRLSWVQDDIQEAEYQALDKLGYLDSPNPANLYLALNLPWVQDEMTETEYAIIDSLGALDFDATDVVFQLLSMPFLLSPDTTDALAIRGMENLADRGRLAALTDHSVFEDGVTEDETTLIAAVGTLRDADEIPQVLAPGGAAVETVTLGTELTPHLKISIVRTDSQSRPGTVEATRDTIQFVENTTGLALPVDHVIIMLDENAVTDKYAGTNYGFAVSYLPKYEVTQHGSREWRQLRLGLVHEIAHYFWRGNENWIDEGLANLYEYRFGLQMGLSHGQLQTMRKGCEAHDLEMLAVWDPDSRERDGHHCAYYLGQLFFQDLNASMDAEAFTAGLQEFYRLSLEAQESNSTPGIAEVRQAFAGQDATIDRHWSGKMNAPENRPFDEGRDRTNHALIEWTQPPTYDGSRSVSFEGVLLDDAVLVNNAPTQGGYANFSLYTADGEWVGSILPGLTSGKWSLDDPGDTVAGKYLINPATRSFIIEFPFPHRLKGLPSDYVVAVWGFQDPDRTPTIGENLDLLSYARIRVL
ncbi:MAG: hypothetical protein OXC99_04160 [Chloroflexi bacterium]|nr:hypothetical protein [Chloroflexota bacterium]